jgi:hypothetical protein
MPGSNPGASTWVYKGGVPLVHEYGVFLDAWEALHGPLPESAGLTARDLRATTGNFLGTDSQGNYYWGIDSFTVLDTQGRVLAAFKIPDALERYLPAVAPSGDIYFIHASKDEVELYRVARAW